MKYIIIFLITFGIAMPQLNSNLSQIYKNYDKYREYSLSTKKIKYENILPLINKLKNNSLFEIKVIGKSFEDRDINLIKVGNGNIKIFLWSQMHGDESTATMALFDIFNFLAYNDQFDEIRNLMLKNLSLYFIPMANPDGAERFQRRNAQGIDVNRDFLRRQTPEANILIDTYESLKADFGFNLHDQNQRSSSGLLKNPATISFLAPAYNYEKELSENRLNAIKVISEMVKALNFYIPGYIAKYPDDFEPRAFGDNFQKKGMSTILIESGGFKNDIEKQYIRKLNFIAMLTAFYSIADKSFLTNNTQLYDALPFNSEFLFDVLLRNLTITKNDKKFIADIGINYAENGRNSSTPARGEISDFGDLSTFFGYQDLDLTDCYVESGKIYPSKINTLEELQKLDFYDLYSEGYIYIEVPQDLLNSVNRLLPINLIANKEKLNDNISIGRTANFLIKKDDKIKFILVNGFLYNVEKKSGM